MYHDDEMNLWPNSLLEVYLFEQHNYPVIQQSHFFKSPLIRSLIRIRGCKNGAKDLAGLVGEVEI